MKTSTITKVATDKIKITTLKLSDSRVGDEIVEEVQQQKHKKEDSCAAEDACMCHAGILNENRGAAKAKTLSSRR